MSHYKSQPTEHQLRARERIFTPKFIYPYKPHRTGGQVEEAEIYFQWFSCPDRKRQ